MKNTIASKFNEDLFNRPYFLIIYLEKNIILIKISLKKCYLNKSYFFFFFETGDLGSV